MHFSIPDTQDFNNLQTGSSYTGFNIHINGNFHCCLRYKQLHSLNDQLKRSLPTLTLPTFPSKKLLPLTPNQVEQRRISLERYIQLVGQDPTFSKSELLRVFLLNAQQESSFTESRETTVDVYLMNGFRIEVNCYTTECSTKVLAKACHNIDVSTEFAYYFALFLMRKENDGSVTLVRKLMDFEAPYVSQRLMDDCTIVIRKNYWDPSYDAQLLQDSVALNLLYIVTLSDIERGWIITTNEVKDQLSQLQIKGNKKEFLEVAKSLPSYGCIKFSNAVVAYPGATTDANTPVLVDRNNQLAYIIIGNKELCVRTNNSHKIQETKFKVTRMRCWRVTTNYADADDSGGGRDGGKEGGTVHNMELSFEYLMAKNCLQWVTIASEQAMLMSVCLQSMVDELLSQKDGPGLCGGPINCGGRPEPMLAYVRRDGQLRRVSESSSTDTISSLTTDADISLQLSAEPMTVRRKLRDKISTTVLFRNGKGSVHNEAFEGIGDDDL